MDEMDDETFNQFIVTDYGNDSEKENEARNSSRQLKTTQNQFKTIVAFMECNNEELLDKETFGQLWVNLAAKLNDIGPPEHTVVEWKKIWSAHKWYKNRRRSDTQSLRSDKPRKGPRLESAGAGHIEVVTETPGQSQKVEGATNVEIIGATNETVPVQSDFESKLDVFIGNQNKIIASLDAILQVLREVIPEFVRKA